jgi:hypothetical protein
MGPAEWTIDELATRVAAALDGSAYPGAPNGRVRDVPDRRSIRWYSTIGLVDRPGAMRGRTALYGPRHLLQLVAVKRRQAEGQRIAEIQAELAGAPDDVLRSIAALPLDELPLGAPALDEPAFKKAAPVADRPRFWAAAPSAATLFTPPEPLVRPGMIDSPARRVSPLFGVPLDDGAVLLLSAAPDEDDVTAIVAAAQPLLDVLAARGLLPTSPTS